MFFPKDRNVEFPKRYKMTKVPGTDDIFDLIPAPGNVLEEGDFWNLRAAQMLQADIRTYKAGRDIKAGEVLSILGGEVRDKIVATPRGFQDFQQGFGNATTAPVVHSFPTDENHDIVLSGADRTIIYRKLLGSASILKTLNLSSGTYTLYDVLRVSENLFAIICSGSIYPNLDGLNATAGTHIVVVSVNGDNITPFSYAKVESSSLQNNNYAIVQFGTTICIVSTRATSVSGTTMYVPRAYVIKNIDTKTPSKKEFAMPTDYITWPYITMMRGVKVNDTTLIIVYRGYNHATLPDTYIASIVRLGEDSVEFSPESDIGNITNGQNAISSTFYLTSFSNRSFIMGVGTSASNYNGKIVLRELFIQNNVVTLGNQCLNTSISSANTYQLSAVQLGIDLFITDAERVYLVNPYVSGGNFLLRETLSLNTGDKIKNSLNLSIADNNTLYVSGLYGTNVWFNRVYKIFFYNSFNIFPVIANSDCISLHDANEGDNVNVILEGISEFPNLKKGSSIISDGVYGVGILDNLIRVWSKDRPGKVIYGSYIGTGDSGPEHPNTIAFSVPVKFVIIQNSDDFTGTWNNAISYIAFINVDCPKAPVLSVSKSTNQTSMSQSTLSVSFDKIKNILSFFNVPYTNSQTSGYSPTYQLNEANKPYRYIAFT